MLVRNNYVEGLYKHSPKQSYLVYQRNVMNLQGTTHNISLHKNSEYNLEFKELLSKIAHKKIALQFILGKKKKSPCKGIKLFHVGIYGPEHKEVLWGSAFL